MKKLSKNLSFLSSNLEALSIKNTILVFLILFSNLTSKSQNLVPNESFELHTQCPNSHSQLYLASPWFSPTATSTDLFDSCSSYYTVPISGLYARDGWAFIGMHLYSDNNREYAQTKLKDSLTKDHCYYVEFYTFCANSSPQRINNIAANFSKLSYTNYPSGPNIPVPLHITNYNNPIISDSIHWTKISGLYLATGGESYITIGNFKNNQNTDTITVHPPSLIADESYYFIDAVSVTSINPFGTLPWSYRDTTITIGDSVYIGNSMGGTFTSSWYTSSGSFIKQDAGIYVRPVTTSSYVVQYTVCGVSRSDTVKVTVLPGVGINKLSISAEDIKIYPVPADDYLRIEISNLELFREYTYLIIYNQLGQIVSEEELNFKENTIRLNTEELKGGVYSFTLKSGKSETVSKRFVISR